MSNCRGCGGNFDGVHLHSCDGLILLELQEVNRRLAVQETLLLALSPATSVPDEVQVQVEDAVVTAVPTGRANLLGWFKKRLG